MSDITFFGEMVFILEPPSNTADGSQTMRIVEGKRKKDDENYIVLDAGFYIVTFEPAQEYKRNPGPINSWFSLYVNPPDKDYTSYMGKRNIDKPVQMKITAPTDGTQLKVYTTLNSEDKGKDITVALRVMRLPLASDLEKLQEEG